MNNQMKNYMFILYINIVLRLLVILHKTSYSVTKCSLRVFLELLV